MTPEQFESEMEKIIEDAWNNAGDKISIILRANSLIGETVPRAVFEKLDEKHSNLLSAVDEIADSAKAAYRENIL